MASPQSGRAGYALSSGKSLSLTPGSRVLQTPLADEVIWRRLKEAGFDEESIKRRDKAALIAYIAKLEAEVCLLYLRISPFSRFTFPLLTPILLGVPLWLDAGYLKYKCLFRIWFLSHSKTFMFELQKVFAMQSIYPKTSGKFVSVGVDGRSLLQLEISLRIRDEFDQICLLFGRVIKRMAVF